MQNSKKGFSLFTPLIGSTVIVIAVMLSAVMIQNDVRISRAIISSFEQSNQEISAKLIKASTEIQMLEGIDKSVESYFNGSMTGPVIYSPCTATCKDDLKEYMITKINNDLQTSLYSSILSHIEDSTDYVAQNRDCPLPSGVMAGITAEDCLAQAISGGLEIEAVSDGADDYIFKFNIKPDYEDAFAVKFKSTADESIVISLAPEGLEYTTDFGAEHIIDETVNIYIYVKNGQNGKDNGEILLHYDGDTAELEKITVHNRTTGTNYNDRKVRIQWDIGYDFTLKKSVSTTYTRELCSLEIGTGNPKNPSWPLLNNRCDHPSKP